MARKSRKPSANPALATENRESLLYRTGIYVRLSVEDNGGDAKDSIQNQTEYNQRYAEMRKECDVIEGQLTKAKKEILAQQGRKEQIRRCLDELRRCGDILDEFDLDLWNAVVESVTVSVNGTLTFCFQDGTEVSEEFPKKK